MEAIRIEAIQLARLADEARAVLSASQISEIAESMDLTIEEVEARFAHASAVFEAAKPRQDAETLAHPYNDLSGNGYCFDCGLAKDHPEANHID